MTSIILAVMMMTQTSHADIKNYEKAKLELISSLETFVNIQECRKDIKSSATPENTLPRSCDKIEYLSKYNFTKKDAASINEYLTKEELRISGEAKVTLDKYRIKSLGKMMLSQKCILSNQLVDLDKYVEKIRTGVDDTRIPATRDDATVIAPSHHDSQEASPEIVPRS